MHVFRWIIGVLSALLGAGSLLSLLLFITLDKEEWIARARTLRRGLYGSLLSWFNVEVWGKVLYTIIHW